MYSVHRGIIKMYSGDLIVRVLYGVSAHSDKFFKKVLTVSQPT
ncbi:hypothetical protein BSP12_238 [Bacillus phage BSP12]|nr:hypothetical protein BSP12_238 [Bacillus phage BSP12]